MAEYHKPHAVFVPFPTQGHINPLLQLAKLFHHRGFHITFVNTDYNHRRFLRTGDSGQATPPDFRFETIPDGLPTSNADATQHVPFLCESTRNNCSLPFQHLLAKLNNTASSNVPPVTCVVADGVMSFTLEASQKLGIPNVLFWTTSASCLLGCRQYRPIIEKGLSPLKDASYLTNGYLETILEWVPGMKNIRLRDIPSFIRTTDPNDTMVDFVMVESERASEATAVIVHSFDALECDALTALSSALLPMYALGPLPLLLDHIPESNLKSLDFNLWKADRECLSWLDSKKPNSVVYVNFGTIAVMSSQQLVEFAWGLSNSGQNFLWIIRPDIVMGNSAILPPEFSEETKVRGLVARWCAQEQVLNHPAIGGFLTHSGWNSTIESISAGVPMLCWPFYADQPTNCRYICNEWGIGMEMNKDVKRDEVERLVRELMVGDKGNEMKKNAMEWKRKAEEANELHGSSYLSFEKLLKVLGPKQ